MDDGGVVPAAKEPSDLLKGGAGDLLAEIHADLPGIGDVFAPLLGGDIKGGQAEMVRHHLDDGIRRDFTPRIRRDNVL